MAAQPKVQPGPGNGSRSCEDADSREVPVRQAIHIRFPVGVLEILRGVPLCVRSLSPPSGPTSDQGVTPGFSGAPSRWLSCTMRSPWDWASAWALRNSLAAGVPSAPQFGHRTSTGMRAFSGSTSNA